MSRVKKPGGYIAVLTVLIACSILSALLFSTSARAVFMRISQSQNEDQVQSRLLADSCVYAAINSYIQNNSYLPTDQPIALDPQTTCTINDIQLKNNQLQLDATGMFGESVVRMHVIAEFDGNTITPFNWSQLPN